MCKTRNEEPMVTLPPNVAQLQSHTLPVSRQKRSNICSLRVSHCRKSSPVRLKDRKYLKALSEGSRVPRPTSSLVNLLVYKPSQINQENLPCLAHPLACLGVERELSCPVHFALPTVTAPSGNHSPFSALNFHLSNPPT